MPLPNSPESKPLETTTDLKGGVDTEFASQLEMVLTEAHVLHSDEEHEKLCNVLLKCKTSFAKIHLTVI